MKHLLLTTIAAVVLVGCGESQQPAPAPEAKSVEPVAKAVKPEPPTQKELYKKICYNQLKQIDAGKELWATQEKRADGDFPNVAQINSYFRDGMPYCPDGGAYTIGAVGADATCSVHPKPLAHGEKPVETNENQDVISTYSDSDGDGVDDYDESLLGSDGKPIGDKDDPNITPTSAQINAGTPPAVAAKPEPPTAKAPAISIHDAARDGNIEAIKQHLAAGTDANEVERKLTQQSKEYIPMSRRDSALDLALKLPSSSDKSVIVNMLRKNGGKTTKQLSNQDALTSACLSGNMMTIKKLIKDGAHINSKGRTGVTPLNIAVYSGNRKVVKFLLDNGADVNFEDKEGYAPLHNVMLKEDAELLIKNGADMRAKTNKGQTPLHTAAILRHLEIIELLVSSGVEVNAIDKSGQTPLDYAKMWDTASAEEKEIANTLLRDNNDDSNSKINKTADLLRKHGAKRGN